MRFKLLTAAFALLITQAALAADHINPTSCPSVDEFKNTGVSSFMRDDDGTWETLNWKDGFGTTLDWTFVIGDISADFPSDALAKGNAAISGLLYKYGPVNMGTDTDPMWYCIYQNPNNGVMGGAVTPHVDPESGKITKFLHKK